jgi:hypothetical protein
MAPERIQRKRTRGFRLPPNTVCVTRPGPLGNPWLIIRDDSGERNGWWVHHDSAKHSHFGGGNFGAFATTIARAREIAVEAFRVTTVHDIPADQLDRIRQADYIACYCDPDDGMACHGDALIEAACRG